eukprot:Pgem_evm1s3304
MTKELIGESVIVFGADSKVGKYCVQLLVADPRVVSVTAVLTRTNSNKPIGYFNLTSKDDIEKLKQISSNNLSINNNTLNNTYTISINCNVNSTTLVVEGIKKSISLTNNGIQLNSKVSNNNNNNNNNNNDDGDCGNYMDGDNDKGLVRKTISISKAAPDHKIEEKSVNNMFSMESVIISKALVYCVLNNIEVCVGNGNGDGDGDDDVIQVSKRYDSEVAGIWRGLW